MKKGIFVIFLFLFQDLLVKINILSTQLQLKKATLGNSVNLIKSVIKTFENDRCDDKFRIIWREIVQFSQNVDISLEIPSKGILKIFV